MIKIENNIVFRNLAINTFFVILGYALAKLIGMSINSIFQPIKSIFLIYSILVLLKHVNNDNIIKKIGWLSILIILTLPFSVSFFGSFKRVIVFLVPMFYLAFTFQLLFRFYSSKEIFYAILKLFRFVYVLPAISFILFGGNLTQNIYGDVVGAFVSNHYGWGAFVFITSQWILIRNGETKLFSFWTLFIPFYFTILLISGSRSGLLSLFIALLIWFFSKNEKTSVKLFFTIVISFIIVSQINSESVLSERLSKTETQLESTEDNTDNDYYNNSATLEDIRSTSRAIASLAFINNPRLYLTGMGIFQFKEGLHEYAPWADPIYYHTGVHNSYGEIYFGSGIIVFAYFFWHFIIIPLWIYFKYLKNIFISVLGIFIIPFFENNVTAGQFLFYPWFITVFFLIYFKKHN